MKCDDCEYRFKCLTNKNKPHKMNGINWQIVDINPGTCDDCIYSPYNKYYNNNWGNWVLFCKKTGKFTSKDGICKTFKEPDWSRKRRKEKKEHVIYLLKLESEKSMRRLYRGRPVYCTYEDTK